MEGYEGKVAFRNRRKCVHNPDYETVANGGKAVYEEVLRKVDEDGKPLELYYFNRRYASQEDYEKKKHIPQNIYV